MSESLKPSDSNCSFAISGDQLKMILNQMDSLGIDTSALSFIEYINNAIRLGQLPNLPKDAQE